MSEGTSWKTPAAIIGIVTVILTAIGVYISKRGSDVEKQKEQHQEQLDQGQQAEQERKNKEKQDRIAELNRQLASAQGQVQDFDNKVQAVYRLIQQFDEKQRDPSISDADRADYHHSYEIEQQNLTLFNNGKKDAESRADAIRKEINELTP